VTVTEGDIGSTDATFTVSSPDTVSRTKRRYGSILGHSPFRMVAKR